MVAATFALADASRVAAATTFVVDTTSDAGDANLDGVCATAANACSLRAAVEEANAHQGADTINFSIAGSGIHTIILGSPLPTLADTTGGTTIDGYSQPGSSANTDPLVSNAVLKVAVQGGGPSSFDALSVSSAANTLRGLAIYGAKVKVNLVGPQAVDNMVVGNFIGTNPTSTYGEVAVVNASSGVVMSGGASRNHVGRPNLADRNVVGGNAFQGVATYDDGTTENVIQNNVIGLRPDGRARLQNVLHGVDLNYGTTSTLVGGTGPLEGNLVSGNDREGIEVSHHPETRLNRVIGNRVGTDAAGAVVTSFSANHDWGIHIEDNVADNEVRGNVVGGNFSGGIMVEGASKRNLITTNFVGVTASGANIANKGPGIKIDTGAQFSVVSLNTVAHNRQGGIVLDNAGSDRNQLTQNSIFANSGPGIDLAPLGVVNVNDVSDVDTGPNQQLNQPVFSDLNPTVVAGNACRNCTVEVFRSDGGTIPSGITYVTTVAAQSSGNFDIPVDLVTNTTIVATATDPLGNTSEFSAALTVAPADPSDPGNPHSPGGSTRMFTGVSPTRVFDTRGGEPDGVVPVVKQRYGGVAELRVKVAGVAGVPSSGVGAVSLNVTVADPVGAGFVTVYPCGERPLASNLNYTAGQVVPNAVIVPVSAAGEVCLFSSNGADLIADINGWFNA